MNTLIKVVNIIHSDLEAPMLLMKIFVIGIHKIPELLDVLSSF